MSVLRSTSSRPATRIPLALAMVILMVTSLMPASVALSAEAATAGVASVLATDEQGGNVAANMLDGDLSTRWMARQRAGDGGLDGPSAVFTLDARYKLSEARIAFPDADRGDRARFILETSLDGVVWTPVVRATSSGTTSQPETFSFGAIDAAFVRYVGEGRDRSRWHSVSSFQVVGLRHTDETARPAPQPEAEEDEAAPAPGSSPEDPDAKRAGVAKVTATHTEEPNHAVNMLDGDLGTRWAAHGRAEGDGDKGPSATFALDGLYELSSTDIAFYGGDNGNRSSFSLEASLDGTDWTPVLKATASGQTLAHETFAFAPIEAAFVRYVGEGRDNSQWNSVTSFELHGTLLGPAPQPEAEEDKAAPAPGSSPEDPDAKRAGVAKVTATHTEEPNHAVNMLDGDLGTRWAAHGRAEGDGDKGPSATFALDGLYELSSTDIAFYGGDNGNRSSFSLEASLDGTDWTPVLKATASGQTLAHETFAFAPIEAAFVRYVGEGRDNSQWNSVTSFELHGTLLGPAPQPEAEEDKAASVPGQVAHGSELTLAHVGPVSGTKLASSGAITSSRDGQVIENLHVTAPSNINAAIVVRHHNVTVRNVHVTAPGSTAGIRIESGVDGALIEHVTIDGTRAEYGTGRDDANWGNEGILAYSKFTARRNHIYDVRQAIQLWRTATASTVVENFIGEVWLNAPGVSTSGISYRGSSSTTELATIARNRIEASAMSGIGLSARDAAVRNVLVQDNHIKGVTSPQSGGRTTGYGIRGGYQGDHRDANRDIRIEGNRFDGTFQWGTNGAVNTSQPGNTFTNNRWVGSNSDIAPKRDL
jgi:hypothetical protein